MDRESLRKIQGIRLKKTVERVYHDTPFYRRKMQELGITPDDINSIDDIVKLPFTTKYDLRDNYPFGLCAVPMSQIPWNCKWKSVRNTTRMKSTRCWL